MVNGFLRCEQCRCECATNSSWTLPRKASLTRKVSRSMILCSTLALVHDQNKIREKCLSLRAARQFNIHTYIDTSNRRMFWQWTFRQSYVSATTFRRIYVLETLRFRQIYVSAPLCFGITLFPHTRPFWDASRIREDHAPCRGCQRTSSRFPKSPYISRRAVV